MAALENIRKRTGLLLTVIAGGIILFLLQDMITGLTKSSDLEREMVGHINGNDVTKTDFSKEVNKITYIMESRSRQASSDAQRKSYRNQAWAEFLLKYAFSPEFEKVGIAITSGEGGEEVDMIQGAYVDAMLAQAPVFQDSLTGEFSVSKVKEYISLLYADQDKNQEQIFSWENDVQSLIKNRLRTKYSNLISKSDFVTSAEASVQYEIEETKADYAYAYVSFSSIPDSTITVEESQLENYIANNSAQFQVEESRSIKMIRFPLLPSGSDSVEFNLELDKIKSEFATRNDDSSYVRYRSDKSIAPSYIISDALSYNLKKEDVALVDTIVGPFMEQGGYTIYKIGDKRVADTTKKASASHILFKVTDAANQPLSEEAKAEQKVKALDVLSKARAGQDFAELAKEYSEGPSSSKGGDLGEFTEGQMVPEFQEAVFETSRKGVLRELVETQFGFHIIKVTEPVQEELVYEYYVAQITKIFNPSSTSKNEIFRTANKALQNIESLEDLEKYAADNNLTLLEANNINRESNSAGAVNDAKPVVQWAFNLDSEEGSVSEKVLQLEKDYIIAAISVKQEKGTSNVSSSRNIVERKVRNQAKADLLIKTLEPYKSEEIFEIKQKINAEKGEGFASSDKVIGSSLNSDNTKVGFEPAITGTALGLADGERSNIIVGENGVFIVEVIKAEKPEATDDLEMYKTRLTSNGNVDGLLNQAIEKLSDITDNRQSIF